MIRNIQKAILGYETGEITFSQAGEDFLIRNFFYPELSSRESGIFVDVGAFHPYKQSNTYYLYRSGWRGINIDPRPKVMDEFKKIRPEDINLEIAVSDQKQELNYYYLGDDSTMNSFSLSYLESIGQKDNIKKKIAIQTETLSEVLEKHLPNSKTFRFLSIDAEGLDLNILHSNNWEKFRPELIAVEIKGIEFDDILKSEISQYLYSKGYHFYSRIPLPTSGINTVFFCDKSRKKS